ncbi:N-acetyltransferase [Mycolicibacterium anyangense]|uniref:N-acetyltransferase n=1 Tax=Mycolicibacterium anyangense TaxID=1431246 RepID=A0A6N4WB68_9MYCO|nr:GNAT family N-acetyltransferase [Mycolicibacterium anyangense]BBZ79256.1 N-acetyltransferase [Mycolicibacterium anyangense]
MTVSAGSNVRFVHVRQDDELATPLLGELAVEYSTRYGGTSQAVLDGLRSYPGHEFEPPHGGLLIGVLDGQPVTGGAFRRFGVVDGLETAELKRIWTDTRFRRQGHASRLLNALEAEIATRGYRRIYLTTGDRQPEAEALYTASGYTRLPEPLPAAGDIYPVAFEKRLNR